jgi:hypothetical protein
MLLGILVIAACIELFSFFPKSTEWENLSAMVKGEWNNATPEMISFALSIPIVLFNSILMFIGFNKAKTPDYNRFFSVTEKKKPA